MTPTAWLATGIIAAALLAAAWHPTARWIDRHIDRLLTEALDGPALDCDLDDEYAALTESSQA